MTRVLADDLEKDRVSLLVDFMTVMSNGQLAQHGKTIEVTGLSNRRVRSLVHKFLHVNHLSEYGVLDTAGSFEIVHIKPETREEAEEHETLKSTRGVPPCPYTTHVNPSDMIELQGQPPTKKTRHKR